MTLLKNAMYNVLLRKENICCLCFEAVETDATRIDDEVFIKYENENIVELSEVLAFIFGRDVSDLASEAVCKQCTLSALNCYMFIKKCKENSQNFHHAIESLNNCLQNASEPERIQFCKSLFVSLDTSYAAKEYYDYKRPVNKGSDILKRFKSISSKKRVNLSLQDMSDDDDFNADIEASIVKQEGTKFKCKTVFRDLILHEDSKPLAYKCKSCLKTFKIYDTLRKHYVKNHAPKIFKCSKCECSFKSCKLLETHLKNCSKIRDLILHKDSEPLAHKCKTCLKTFNVYDSLKRHYLRVHASKPFKCPKCESSYASFTLLETHLGTCSATVIPRDLILQKDSKPLAYKCHSCLKTFKDFKTLKNHYLRIHAPKTFKCSKCERAYGAFKFLKTHLKTCRGTAPIPRDVILCNDSQPLAYKCNSCLKTYNDFKTLRQHYLCVHAPKKFKCSKCEYSYGSYYFLKAHLKNSHVTCICAECGKTFNNQYSLKKHELGHRLRLDCQKCGRVYQNKDSFRNHTVSGVCQKTSGKVTNEGPFICETCNKPFCRKNSLTAHIRSAHSDIETVSCDVCSAKFKYRSTLKRHKQRHSNPQSKLFKI